MGINPSENPQQEINSYKMNSELNTMCQDRCSSPIVKIFKHKTLSFSQIVAIIFLVSIPLVEFAPVASDAQAMVYLSQFGYINPSVANPSSGALVDGESWNKAISEFQSFAGLNITGELNPETIETMSLPRCGVKDRVGFGSNSRSKRYALQGSRWRVKDLTYKISKYPRNSKLTREIVDDEVKRAFDVWTKHTDLKFTQLKTGQVHIEIRFEKGEHGDGDPFDGRGGTLAHAYFPVYGGDAHFDDAEEWTAKSYRGSSLFQVAAHEFGHSLGLSHSDIKSALMAPFYRGYDPSFQLDSDDITGIQKLYGKKTSPSFPSNHPTYVPPSRPTPSEGSNEKLCADPNIDAIFNDADGNTYVFKGLYYYKLTEHGIAPGYPQPISKTWIGLPGNMDTAFTYKNGKTYFFKGSKYWRFVGTKMDGDYPKEINEGFNGIPDNVDAALVWSGNGKIYFYKGDKFWRFDPIARPPVKSTYPKPISNWEGIPNNVNTAFQYTNGYTYFYKEGAYYRFNDRTFSVDRADPAFPRSTAFWWLGCKEAPQGTVPGKGYLQTPEDEPPEDDSYMSDLVLDAAGSDERNSESSRNNSFQNKQSSLSTLIFGVVLYMWRSI